MDRIIQTIFWLHTLVEGLFGFMLLLFPQATTPQEGLIALGWMRNYAAAAIAVASLTLVALIAQNGRLDKASNAALIVFHLILCVLVSIKIAQGLSQWYILVLHGTFLAGFLLHFRRTFVQSS